MTSKIKGALLAAAAIAGFAGVSTANAAPFTATAQAKAKILKQISVTKSADLNFGSIVVGTVAGNVAISTAGARTCAAALTCSGTVSAAGFDIVGSKSEIVTISADSSVSLNTTPAGTPMVATLTASGATATLGASDGKASFTVGGSLPVAASQADGSYAGTFNVSVDYQ